MKQIEVPHITREERICVAIMLTKAVPKSGNIPVWDKWADDYLNNIDRSTAGAYPADAAAYAAANAGDYAADPAAYAAAYAADAAAYAAAYAAARAVAYPAARAAANAGARAADANPDLDLADIITKAIEAERKRVRGETNVQES